MPALPPDAPAPADGASNNFRISYVGGWPGDASGETVIHSGVTVPGWKQVPAFPGVWAAPLPKAVTDTRQFYVNGARVPLATTASGLPGSLTITSTGYKTTASLPWAFSPLQDQGSLEFLYTGVGSSWTEARVRVASVVAIPGGGSNITMAEPGFSIARNRFYGQGVSVPTAVTNVASLLSAATPGQGAISSAAGLLYYVPGPGIDMSTAVFTVRCEGLCVCVYACVLVGVARVCVCVSAPFPALCLCVWRARA